jgi:phospholipid/cholesterol/gamma-HCH transport system substrate-binding protein
MSSREGTGRIRRTFERVRNEPGLGRNVAVLLVLIVAATAVGSVILSRQRFSLPWDNKFSFYAVFPGAPGVSPGHGQEVRIAGVPVGLIDDASVDSGGHARLKLTIDPKYPRARSTRCTSSCRPVARPGTGCTAAARSRSRTRRRRCKWTRR